MGSTAHLGSDALRAAATYGAAADHYTAPALAFWDRYGAETVRRLSLTSGKAVLDVCCGAGGSALVAGRMVGPGGRVLGIDVAEPLLRVARRRAAVEGLDAVQFRCRDATQTGLDDCSFDAVVCVFGVFFAPDMQAFVREMARVTKPGGAVAITTWGPGLFEPANTVFWDVVRSHDPSLYKAYNPWDEVTTPAQVMALLAGAGLRDIEAEAVSGAQPLAAPDDFWDIVLGSGYRATVDALPVAVRTEVRAQLIETLRGRSVKSVKTDAVLALARRAR